ncbi:unnamed protein product, partial [Iphiclides podalirius]
MPRHFVCLLLYLDERNWPGPKCNGVGTRQSPIDIRTSDVIKDFGKEFVKHGALEFDGYQQVLLTAINNDYTVMFSTEGDRVSQPKIRGGPLAHEYRLEQMHLHWLSEHAIDGIKFPVEIHFVHVRADLDVKRALKRKDGLAILATFCKIINNEEQTETSFDDLTFILSRLERVGRRVSGSLLNLTKLFSPTPSLYYTYSGSLTSPLCNEVVTWIVFPEHIYLTEAQVSLATLPLQYNLLEKVREGRYNFRRLQRLDGRRVYQPPSDFLVEPLIVTSLRNAVNTVTEFFANITKYGGLLIPVS